MKAYTRVLGVSDEQLQGDLLDQLNVASFKIEETGRTPQELREGLQMIRDVHAAINKEE